MGKINETSLSKKEEFYGNITMKDIVDADYIHAQRFCKNSEIKNLAKCQNLYLKSDTLLLADVFQNVSKIFWKIHHLDPANVFSAPGLPWQAAEVKLELLTDIDVILMFEKGHTRRICNAIHQYAKAKNK